MKIPVAAVAVLLSVPHVAFAEEHLHLIELTSGEKVVNLSKAPDAPGDQLVFSNPLESVSGHASAGTSRGACVRTEVGKWWTCRWTMLLAGGTLEVAGSYPDTGDCEFAVLGGTGRYAGARGTIKAHPRDAKNSAYELSIDLK